MAFRLEMCAGAQGDREISQLAADAVELGDRGQTLMTPPAPRPPRIAALRADDSKAAQALLLQFARRAQAEGLRVGGVVQVRFLEPGATRSSIMLEDVDSGARFKISQDLGRGSVACNLDSGELALACAAVEHAARGGVDLVVLSKFSKQEAERSGLCDAFRAAIRAGAPIVAAVSPDFLDEWAAFAGDLYEFVAPDLSALDDWRRRATARS